MRMHHYCSECHNLLQIRNCQSPHPIICEGGRDGEPSHQSAGPIMTLHPAFQRILSDPKCFIWPTAADDFDASRPIREEAAMTLTILPTLCRKTTPMVSLRREPSQARAHKVRAVEPVPRPSLAGGREEVRPEDHFGSVPGDCSQHIRGPLLSLGR